MISRCFDKNRVMKSVLSLDDSEYLKGIILMYLNAYGTEYDFCEFYLQTDNIGKVTAVSLRYNTFLYCIMGDEAYTEEISLWLGGFGQVTVFANIQLPAEHSDKCILMHRRGSVASDKNRVVNVNSSADIMKISRMVNKDLPEDIAKEYFLDLSYLLRHNTAEIKGVFSDEEIVSFMMISRPVLGKSVINLVYTSEDFRGNGYASAVISGALTDDVDYYLICAESLKCFYERNGFTPSDICYKLYL